MQWLAQFECRLCCWYHLVHLEASSLYLRQMSEKTLVQNEVIEFRSEPRPTSLPLACGNICAPTVITECICNDTSTTITVIMTRTKFRATFRSCSEFRKRFFVINTLVVQQPDCFYLNDEHNFNMNVYTWRCEVMLSSSFYGCQWLVIHWTAIWRNWSSWYMSVP